jgi:hypothetical protein
MHKFDNKVYLFSSNDVCDIPVPKSKCSSSGPIHSYFATLDLNTGDYKYIDGFYDSKSSYIGEDIRILSSRDYLHHELVLLDSNNEISSKVKFLGFNNYAIKGKNKLGEFFVIANDLINQRKQIFLLTEENYISPHLDGLWNNKDWSHQGLSIQTGTRQDSSTYLFASLLTFRDGYPLWLAGVSDINPLQESVELELYEYEGSSFLSDHEEFESLKFNFGKLKITPQTCNSIHLELEMKHSKELMSLPMQRIQNKEIDAICTDY